MTQIHYQLFPKEDPIKGKSLMAEEKENFIRIIQITEFKDNTTKRTVIKLSKSELEKVIKWFSK